MTFRARRRTTELRLPAWRPGRYLVQNYAANVRQWGAANEAGEPLGVVKSDKSTWVVTSPVGQKVVFSYRFYAAVLDAGSSWLDETEAYFNGTNLFVMVADRRTAPVELKLKVPRGWDVRTQLKRGASNRWTAPNYDYLADSPTIISPALREETFVHEGSEISLVFQGAERLDIEPFVAPTRDIVRTQAELFGELPTSRYAFLYHVASLWHGVEHEDSCSITLKRSEIEGARPGDKAFDRFLDITSHEFFHVWNVKRLLPRAFVPYDYSRENYTRLLWLMEGVTSYYAEKTLARSRVWTFERYLDHLTEHIGLIEEVPGQKAISVAQASFDAWLQDPSQMHDRQNAWVSFYAKGEVVGALLDLEIVAATKGRRSFDDVMRMLWRRFGRTRRGITEQDVVDAVAQVAGKDFSSFFARFIDGVEELPYEEIFARVGVAVSSDEGKGRWIGLRAKALPANGIAVDFVIAGSPAASAGLLPNDEIIAIDAVRVKSAAELDRQLSISSGDVTILWARNDIVRSTVVRPVSDPTKKPKLRAAGEATPEQLRLRARWIEGRTD